MAAAALYDIHGNLPALEAVLEEISREDVDRIIIGGDVIPGPMPRETLERLLHLNVPTQFIYGNGETAVLREIAGRDPQVPQPFREIIRWSAQQIRGRERLLASWPKTLRLDLRKLGHVLFCHATPQNEHDIFTRLTPEQQLVPVFTATGARTVVCGHTHMQFDRMIGGVRVVNAGSVGMPFGQPGAYWLLLGDDLELRRTEYNLANAAERVRASGYPQAEHFASGNIRQPPSEAEMLSRFGSAS